MADTAVYDQITRTVETGDDANRLGLDRFQALQTFNARLVCMTVDESSYAEVVRGVWRIVGCDYCALFLFDNVSNELKLKSATGYEGLDANYSVSLEDEDNIHVQAFTEEYLIHMENLADLPVDTLAPDQGSSLILPVISNRGPVGVFDFGSCKANGFSADDINMANMLVDQMAYSLENIRLVTELSNSRDAVIRGMAMLAEMRDSHIGGHLNRLCATARCLAEKLADEPAFREVTPAFLHEISRAAALHDVGKVGIPDSILLKPGKLTDDEFNIMKSHTIIGADLLRGLMRDFGQQSVIVMGAEVAMSHHERWDGTGYPSGLAGDEIPLAARIVSICDVYDALTSRRVYKEAWDHEETFKVIREGSGTQFDPRLVAIFMKHPADLLAVREQYPE